MSLRRKLVIGAAGFSAFVVACAGAATLQMIMGGLIQSRSADPPGALEPSPEEKAKQEWQASQQGKQEQAAPDKTEEQKPQVTPAEIQSQPQQSSRNQEPAQATAPPAPPAPPAPSGPGNFDSFSAPQRNFSGTTGPGNL